MKKSNTMNDERYEAWEKRLSWFYWMIIGVILIDIFTDDWYDREFAVGVMVALFLYLLGMSRIERGTWVTYILVSLVICCNALYLFLDWYVMTI